MPIRLPLVADVEYRGVAAGGEFSDRQTGEVVAFGPKLKFEYEDEAGDVVLVPIGASMLDKCEPPFDHTTLKKGDEVTLRGSVVIQDRGSDRDSYFQVTRVQRRDAAGRLKSIAGAGASA